jgi:oligopeptide/dipeptide ABC transporter ATP-binding protein
VETLSTGSDPSGPLLDVRGLTTTFITPSGPVAAVDQVSFSVDRAEVLGIVGESGCGKSVTALSVMRLIADPPGRITAGKVMFDGDDLLTLPEKAMRKVRGNRISIIFQEPMTALNPVFSVGDQITEGLRLHLKMSRREALDRAVELLTLVGIPSPAQRVKEYPHQLSGGMRQRVMIAMAIGCNPDLLFADEPTTALDVTIQAQILALLADLREKTGMGLVLISHDLGIIAEVADRVVVMYAGRVVEQADTMTLFKNPAHPYTRGLLASLPNAEGVHGGRLATIPGVVPSLAELKPGCKFKDRCGDAFAACDGPEPPLIDLGGGHLARCFLHGEAGHG